MADSAYRLEGICPRTTKTTKSKTWISSPVTTAKGDNYCPPLQYTLDIGASYNTSRMADSAYRLQRNCPRMTLTSKSRTIFHLLLRWQKKTIIFCHCNTHIIKASRDKLWSIANNNNSNKQIIDNYFFRYGLTKKEDSQDQNWVKRNQFISGRRVTWMIVTGFSGMNTWQEKVRLFLKFALLQ